ncbi:hypothetical protein AB5I41_12505 [Sphingomonas sp. MMS24-JH45]
MAQPPPRAVHRHPHAARLFAEPIWYSDGQLGSWRPTRLLDGIDCADVTSRFGYTGALIAPVHLPGGQVGAVVWVATEPVDMAAIFAAGVGPMFALATRFLAAHAEVAGHPPPPRPCRCPRARCNACAGPRPGRPMRRSGRSRCRLHRPLPPAQRRREAGRDDARAADPDGDRHGVPPPRGLTGSSGIAGRTTSA